MKHEIEVHPHCIIVRVPRAVVLADYLNELHRLVGTDLVLDLGEVRNVNPRDVRALFKLAEKIVGSAGGQRRGSVHLCCPRKSVRDLLLRMQLHYHFDIYRCRQDLERSYSVAA